MKLIETSSSSRVPQPANAALIGLTWDNPRGYGPLDAAGAAFSDASEGSSLTVRWDVQPLSGFESRSISESAEQYDLIVMDHPHTLAAARRGCLIPIGELDDVYVGKTRTSYCFDGSQWAAPIDAACHVSAWRAGRESGPIGEWAEVFAAAQEGLRIAAPLAGVHALMALLTLVASEGIDVDQELAWQRLPEVESALLTLRRLCDVSSVAKGRDEGTAQTGLDWNPLDALNALANDRCDYVPLTFGYAHFVDQGVCFGDLPTVTPGAAPRGVLGGAGLAVSARCAHADEAIRFVRFLAGTQVQTEAWAPYGAQPAHRAAWDQLARENSFYRDTRKAIEAAFVRPRPVNWNSFQTKAGSAIEAWLRSGQRNCRRVVDTLGQLSTSLSA